MTPSGVALMGMGYLPLFLVTGFVTWKTWGWIPLAGFICLFFVSRALRLIPFPTYEHCCRAITKELSRSGHTELLEEVQRVR